VKADERGGDMLRPSDTEDEPCSSVLDRLKTLDEVGGKSEQDAVAVSGLCERQMFIGLYHHDNIYENLSD